MKIDFEGVTRVLDLEHVKLRHGVAVQEFTGLPLLDWQRSLVSRDIEPAGKADKELTLAQAASKMTAFGDPGWIVNIAAAHWLMLAQAGENPPPLDDEYDCDVLSFAMAFFAALVEEVKARKVPDKPDPTVPPGRRAPSSRRTTSPKKGTSAAQASRPLPLTGS